VFYIQFKLRQSRRLWRDRNSIDGTNHPISGRHQFN